MNALVSRTSEPNGSVVGSNPTQHVIFKQKIDRDNLWPKIYKAMSKSTHNGQHRHDDRDVYAKNKYGTLLTKEDLERDDED